MGGAVATKVDAEQAGDGCDQGLEEEAEDGKECKEEEEGEEEDSPETEPPPAGMILLKGAFCGRVVTQEYCIETSLPLDCELPIPVLIPVVDAMKRDAQNKEVEIQANEANATRDEEDKGNEAVDEAKENGIEEDETKEAKTNKTRLLSSTHWTRIHAILTGHPMDTAELTSTKDPYLAKCEALQQQMKTLQKENARLQVQLESMKHLEGMASLPPHTEVHLSHAHTISSIPSQLGADSEIRKKPVYRTAGFEATGNLGRFSLDGTFVGKVKTAVHKIEVSVPVSASLPMVLALEAVHELEAGAKQRMEEYEERKQHLEDRIAAKKAAEDEEKENKVPENDADKEGEGEREPGDVEGDGEENKKDEDEEEEEKEEEQLKKLKKKIPVRPDVWSQLLHRLAEDAGVEVGQSRAVGAGPEPTKAVSSLGSVVAAAVAKSNQETDRKGEDRKPGSEYKPLQMQEQEQDVNLKQRLWTIEKKEQELQARERYVESREKDFTQEVELRQRQEAEWRKKLQQQEDASRKTSENLKASQREFQDLQKQVEYSMLLRGHSQSQSPRTRSTPSPSSNWSMDANRQFPHGPMHTSLQTPTPPKGISLSLPSSRPPRPMTPQRTLSPQRIQSARESTRLKNQKFSETMAKHTKELEELTSTLNKTVFRSS